MLLGGFYVTRNMCGLNAHPRKFSWNLLMRDECGALYVAASLVHAAGVLIKGVDIQVAELLMLIATARITFYLSHCFGVIRLVQADNEISSDVM